MMEQTELDGHSAEQLIATSSGSEAGFKLDAEVDEEQAGFNTVSGVLTVPNPRPTDWVRHSRVFCSMNST
jgi:HSP20 family molecular chaperone IbpA